MRKIDSQGVTPNPQEPRAGENAYLIAYREEAVQRMKDKKDQRLRNHDSSHAKILIDVMVGMASAEDEVGIYSGKLSADFYERALAATKASKITILVDDDSGTSWLDEELDESQRNKITVKQISRPRSNHFFYVSGGAFRFEVDKNTFAAEANFYEPSVVSNLKDGFNRYLQG